MKQTVFADTAAWLALINKSDTLHKKYRNGWKDYNDCKASIVKHYRETRPEIKAL